MSLESVGKIRNMCMGKAFLLKMWLNQEFLDTGENLHEIRN